MNWRQISAYVCPPYRIDFELDAGCVATCEGFDGELYSGNNFHAAQQACVRHAAAALESQDYNTLPATTPELDLEPFPPDHGGEGG